MSSKNTDVDDKNLFHVVLYYSFIITIISFAVGLLTAYFFYHNEGPFALVSIAVVWFALFVWISSPALEGRVIIGGMESPFILSAGSTAMLFSAMFMYLSDVTNSLYLVLALLFFIRGARWLYVSLKEGPTYGWNI